MTIDDNGGPVFRHVAPLASMVRATRDNVHFLNVAGTETMCGRFNTYKPVPGTSETVKFLFDTPGKVTCHQCRKGLEMAARHGLSGLSSADLETAAQLIFKLKITNGGKS